MSYPLDYEGSGRRRRLPSVRLPARTLHTTRGPQPGLSGLGAALAVDRLASPRRPLRWLTWPFVLDGLSTLLRLASRVICLIVIVSFAIFALEETSSASTHQQNEINESGPPGSATPQKGSSAKSKSAIHEAIDEASSSLTSPFSGVTAGWHSQWAIRGVLLALALLVYGFGLGFLARTLRVRV